MRVKTQGDVIVNITRTRRTVTFGFRAFAVSGPTCWNYPIP